ncbi:Retrotransposon Copia-like, N-terminal [Dillenia turbinata]|uniref:Retrotransposon Copia-like, N-terminal n=1 Tax=Dillenia turbinata TaxID=194707 RepID=A0AAN8ZHD5_9MAGN
MADGIRSVTENKVGLLGDNPSLQISPVKLDSTNYLSWSRSCLLFIQARGLKGYVTGEKPKPAITDSTYNQWEAENSLQELDYYQAFQAICPEDATKFQKLVEKERIYDFFAGLNMEYDQKRVQVLVEKAGLVSKTTREQTKTGDSSTSDKDQLKCDYCGKPGHTKGRCWKLHGRPNKSRGGKYTRSPRPQANMSETVETPTSSEITNGGFSNEEDGKLGRKHLEVPLGKGRSAILPPPPVCTSHYSSRIGWVERKDN